VKKYIADQVDNKEVLENYFLGRTLRIEKRKLEINRQKNNYENNHEIVFEVRNFLVKSGVRLNLQFKSGEITTFLSLNKDTEERIFCSLSGRKIDDHASYLILRRTNNMLKYNDFIYNRIISIDHLGEANRDGTMPTMTAAANVLLPSMGKLNSFEYILNEKGLNSVADSMLASSGWDYSAEKVSDMTTNERIRIIMERWKLFKPRVLIFHNPFGNCDSYGVALVKSYMRYFAKEGTAVIIIKNRHEYISEFSDRIIKVDDM
jgi:ABC-type sugar transport system ATPase subunit